MCEQRLVGAVPQPVGAAVLDLLQPRGQLVVRPQLGVDDRARADLRADHRVAAHPQSLQQRGEPGTVDDGGER